MLHDVSVESLRGGVNARRSPQDDRVLLRLNRIKIASREKVRVEPFSEMIEAPACASQGLKPLNLRDFSARLKPCPPGSYLRDDF